MNSILVESAPLIGREVLKHVQPGWKRGPSGATKTAFFGENGDVVLCFYDKDGLHLFRKWVDFCQSHSSPYLPKYRSRWRRGRIGKDSTPVSMIRMEHLTPMPAHLSKLMTEIDEVQHDLNQDRKLRFASDFNHLIQMVASKTTSRLALSRLQTAVTKIEGAFPGFLDVYLEIAKACPPGARIDSLTGHDGARNVMMRGDTPVIIDPWF